ncbi:unnamed protein product [Menidia menidia]|uniref:(Atlantic silverside) hypothetical protein n=1 Tax=Menidia menidia TaxID=238744 RepID=A0A8S4AKM7_9TELE|nr:unnamed protein product [Menidia menidia]
MTSFTCSRAKGKSIIGKEKSSRKRRSELGSCGGNLAGSTPLACPLLISSETKDTAGFPVILSSEDFKCTSLWRVTLWKVSDTVGGSLG